MTFLSPLDEAALSAACHRLWPGASARCLDATSSTNDDARALGLSGAPHGSVITADSQSSGRGRRGTPWISPPGRNLILSILLRPSLPPELWSRLTHAAALAVTHTLDLSPALPPATIKWPNDVLLANRKVSGILLESVLHASSGFVVVGLGINLNATPDDFPPDLRPTATSIFSENGGILTNRTAFTISFLESLARTITTATADFPSLLAACSQRSSLTGKSIRLTSHGTEFTGSWAGLGPNGELLLRLPNGTTTPFSSADLVRPID
jgi:BirA family transcriptional regulator, biotin operon repressor / biotin---[acetyl-CoA-carboxylase] ligase